MSAPYEEGLEAGRPPPRPTNLSLACKLFAAKVDGQRFATLRTLFVSTTLPNEPDRMVHGIYRRMALHVAALASVGKLDTLFYVPPAIDRSPESAARYQALLSDHWNAEIGLTLSPARQVPDGPSRWRMYGPGIFDCFEQWKFQWAAGEAQRQAFERALEARPDLVFVHRLAAMAPVLHSTRGLPPIVFDLDDIEHLALLRGVGQPPVWPAKRLLYLQVPTLWWGERRAIERAGRTFVCSERDAAYLRRTMRVGKLRVIPNAVEIREPRPVPDDHTILFLGNLGHPPNANAAAFLLREVWPRVRSAVPNARLLIAGPNPESVPGFPSTDRCIEFTGFVDDLEQIYRRTRVVCTPILSGGGTRIKIIEAAAFGKPIVSTRLGAEGLSLEDGREILLRDDAARIAEACVRLLTDDALSRSLGGNAWRRVAGEYSETRVVERIQEEVLDLVRAGC